MDSPAAFRANGRIVELLARSEGIDGYAFVSDATRYWLAGLGPQMPERFWVHRDAAAREAASLLGAAAFVLGNRIFLGNHPDGQREAVLRHELTHLAQVQLALRHGRAALSALVEHEADEISRLPTARPVRYGASPDGLHPIIWWVAVGVGLYMVLRPRPANAPGPNDKLVRGPSMAQITAEAATIFVVPGGALGLGSRLGLGFFGRSMLAGAATNMSFRFTHDIGRGGPSPPLMYVFDAGTGAVLGFVIPGGIRFVGKLGSYPLDALASRGMSKSDIALTKMLAEEAAKAPLNAAQAQQILASRGLTGRISQWWLNRRGVIQLYRGQASETKQILSPLARTEGVAASEELLERVRSFRLTDREIAGYTARYHSSPVPGFATLPELAGVPIGAVGIPTTGIPGIAANFGEQGVIYVIRVPVSSAISPLGWQGLALESEFIILNQVPKRSIVQVIPASRVLPLTVDESGLLVPGR